MQQSQDAQPEKESSQDDQTVRPSFSPCLPCMNCCDHRMQQQFNHRSVYPSIFCTCPASIVQH